MLGLAALRPALFLAVGTVIFAFLNPRRVNAGALFRTWPARVMGGLGLLACISVPFSISIGGSAVYILTSYSKTLILAFLLVVAIRGARDLKSFVWAYVLSCGILAFVGTFVVGVSKIRGVQSYDANDLALVLLVGLPLALLTLQTSTSKLGKTASLLIVLGIASTLALSRSRGGFLGLVAVGLALFFMLKQVPLVKRVGFLSAIVLALAVAAPADYWEMIDTLASPTEDYNWTASHGRKEIWKRGMGYMMSRPITGLGIGNFSKAEGTISDVAVNFVDRIGVRLRWTAPHSSYVQAGAELGLPGLFLFSSLVFGGVLSMLRLRRRLPAWWARGDPEQRFIYYASGYLPVSLVAFASTSFFLSFAWQDPIYVLGAFMAGLYASVEAKQRCMRGGIVQASLIPSPRPRGWRVPRTVQPAARTRQVPRVTS
jgi:hypothetical protein